MTIGCSAWVVSHSSAWPGLSAWFLIKEVGPRGAYGLILRARTPATYSPWPEMVWAHACVLVIGVVDASVCLIQQVRELLAFSLGHESDYPSFTGFGIVWVELLVHFRIGLSVPGVDRHPERVVLDQNAVFLKKLINRHIPALCHEVRTMEHLQESFFAHPAGQGRPGQLGAGG